MLRKRRLRHQHVLWTTKIGEAPLPPSKFWFLFLWFLPKISCQLTCLGFNDILAPKFSKFPRMLLNAIVLGLGNLTLVPSGRISQLWKVFNLQQQLSKFPHLLSFCSASALSPLLTEFEGKFFWSAQFHSKHKYLQERSQSCWALPKADLVPKLIVESGKSCEPIRQLKVFWAYQRRFFRCQGVSQGWLCRCSPHISGCGSLFFIKFKSFFLKF